MRANISWLDGILYTFSSFSQEALEFRCVSIGSKTVGVSKFTASARPLLVLGDSPIVRMNGECRRGKDARTLVNLLTPTVFDPNAYTPEFKGFLVKLEKV